MIDGYRKMVRVRPPTRTPPGNARDTFRSSGPKAPAVPLGRDGRHSTLKATRSRPCAAVQDDGFAASPHDIDLIDRPGPPAATDGLALPVAAGSIDDDVLARLPGSSVRYSGRDDCYVHLRTTDPTLA